MDNKAMENKSIPYLVYEGAQARNERKEKRLIIALIIAIALIFVSNAIWLIAWTSYDYTSEDIMVRSDDGIANYIGNDGDINNGLYPSETQDKN